MSHRFRVLKFGGTSLAGPARIAAAAEIVAREAPRGSLVVASAMGGATDALLRLVAASAAGAPAVAADLLAELVARHRVAALGLPLARRGRLELLGSLEDERRRIVRRLETVAPRGRAVDADRDEVGLGRRNPLFPFSRRRAPGPGGPGLLGRPAGAGDDRRPLRRRPPRRSPDRRRRRRAGHPAARGGEVRRHRWFRRPSPGVGGHDHARPRRLGLVGQPVGRRPRRGGGGDLDRRRRNHDRRPPGRPGGAARRADRLGRGRGDGPGRGEGAPSRERGPGAAPRHSSPDPEQLPPRRAGNSRRCAGGTGPPRRAFPRRAERRPRRRTRWLGREMIRLRTGRSLRIRRIVLDSTRNGLLRTASPSI